MRENRPYGSQGGVAERRSLPLSSTPSFHLKCESRSKDTYLRARFTGLDGTLSFRKRFHLT